MPALLNRDILVRRVEDEARVVFLYPYDTTFIQACKALKVRGLLAFGENPIRVEGSDYKAWYADIEKLDEDTYGRYAMLVRDFFTSEARNKFNALFTDIKHDNVQASIHNPSKFMEAQREVVEKLVEKYKNTTSPLEFYGSRHQAEGVALFLQSVKAKNGVKGFINADAQGLGKCRQAIVAAIEAGFKNILIVTTKSAKSATWPKEIRLVDPKATITLANHKKYSERARWTVIHWDSLRLADERFFQNATTFDLLILDEMHYASNRESQRGAATEKIGDAIAKVWGLTGTPVTKRPRNVINLLRLVRHPMVDGEAKVWEFLTRYCGVKDEYERWDFNRAVNIDELHEQLRGVFIRREKDQTNLPPKVRQVQTVELSPTQRAAYESAWPDYLSDPANAIKASQPGYPTDMVKTMVSRKAIALVKTPQVMEWADALLDAGEKVVIFTAFDDVWEAYAKYYGAKAVGIRGEVKEADRLLAVERFQNDPEVRVFIGNIQAAGEGITLTAASYLAFNDITWRPVDQLQAEDRIHRGGATKTCFVTYFLGADTVDEVGFTDFIKHKDIVQRIVNRRDDDNKPIDPGFVGELPVARATEGIQGNNDVEMNKLARLIDTNSLKSGDAAFAESLMQQYVSSSRLSDKQFNAVRRMLLRYRERLTALEAA